MIGTEIGLRLLWCGGRPVTSEDEAPSNSRNEGAAFERGEQEHDPIVQSVDLPLGVAVLRVAFPYIPTDALQQDQSSLPSLVTQNLVAAVVCSDSSVRLVTLPLAPPSTRAVKKVKADAKPFSADGRVGSYGEQVVTISGANDHQAIPRCVALTWAPALVEADSDVEMDEEALQSENNTPKGRRRVISRTRSRSRSRSLARGGGWDILIASCSSNSSRILLIHRIPILPDGSNLDLQSADISIPWSIQHLPSAITSCHFNPSLPGDGRNRRLLVAESQGTVRVLDCLSTSTSKQCSCLVSLYPIPQASGSGRGTRKHLLDAQWVLGGTAILALLDDGEWGIWDLGGHGTESQSGTLAPQPPTMGSFFDFASIGHIDSRSTTLKANGANLKKTKEGSSVVKLAPTTPSTRRMRQENLFSGPPLHQTTNGPARGGISIIPSEDANASDEAILLWHNHVIVEIPSLRTHRTSKGSGNLFNNNTKGEARVINHVSLRGERRTGVSLLPHSIHNSVPEHPVLVAGETCFVIVTGPSSGQQITSKRGLESPRADQRLLRQGDLDLDGMDRVLSTITKDKPSQAAEKLTTRGLALKRKVGFLDT